ncbi:MAG: FMN-binding protein [Deltaproteobacteria bacterium]|nr:FMN-binding protein [Deltaproteobacteria bacterium]
MSDAMKSVVFAFAMCLVCGLLLTAASNSFSGLQKKNILLDRRKNILKAAGILDSAKKYTPKAIESLYAGNITIVGVAPDGRIVTGREALAPGGRVLPLYLYADEMGRVREYIIPIESNGLWGKIYGYLALESDGATIAGFTVYKHSETPGLGGEIEKAWFDRNFLGKKIVDQAGNFVSVKIAKGKAKQAVGKDRLVNYVDGISGATLTGSFLTKGLKRVLSEYEPVSLAFRENRLRCRITGDVPACGSTGGSDR